MSEIMYPTIYNNSKVLIDSKALAVFVFDAVIANLGSCDNLFCRQNVAVTKVFVTFEI